MSSYYSTTHNMSAACSIKYDVYLVVDVHANVSCKPWFVVRFWIISAPVAEVLCDGTIVLCGSCLRFSVQVFCLHPRYELKPFIVELMDH